MAVMKKERGAGMSSPCDASRVAQVMCDAGLQRVELGETMENYAKLAAFSDAAAKAIGLGSKIGIRKTRFKPTKFDKYRDILTIRHKKSRRASRVEEVPLSLR